jgi:hypothetical protein
MQPWILRVVWLVVGACAAGCGSSSPEPKAIDVVRPGSGMTDGGGQPGECVDAGLPVAGSSNVKGRTPLGPFTAVGARALGRCLWFQFISVDARGCQQHVITAATGLRVPPWFEGSRLPVGISIATSDGQSSPHVASGTLTVDAPMEEAGSAVLRGSLAVEGQDWALEGTFDAPWTDLPCR